VQPFPERSDSEKLPAWPDVLGAILFVLSYLPTKATWWIIGNALGNSTSASFTV
jgi:hypothetical protein